MSGRHHRTAVRVLATLCIGAAGCHDADAPPAATPPLGVSEHVLEPMGRGGRVRRVIYEPAPDLARPEPGELELPFPGPGIDAGEPPPEPVPDTANANPDTAAARRQ